MKILVFGSLNIDKTYYLKEFVRPGQTVSARELRQFCGGKGFNQAVAIRRAGNPVCFAGAVGADGQMILDALNRNDIDAHCVNTLDCPTGHAIIQVDDRGQNCIIIHAGANGEITSEDVKKTLAEFEAGDLVVLQNEISCVDEIIEKAYEKGMKVAYNPSPFNEKCLKCDLNKVTWLLVNETEGEAMTGRSDKDGILEALHREYPTLNVVLTLGSQGSVYMNAQGERVEEGIFKVKAVDTTAAGDTFTGYFLSAMLKGKNAQTALREGTAAAAISVSRAGAEPSIPVWDEVERLLRS